MITINGSVSDNVKKALAMGRTHTVARQHGNLIIAGGIIEDAVPSDYKVLTHIQSSGSECIDIGYVLKSEDIVEMDYELLDISAAGDKFLLGLTGEDTGIWVETYGSTNQWYCRYGSVTSAKASFNSKTKGTLVLKKGSFSVDGANLMTLDYTAMPTNSICIFGRKVLTSDTIQGRQMRCEGFRVRNGGHLIMNLVPCESSSGEKGMYDTICHRFYTNSGTGTFTGG